MSRGLGRWQRAIMDLIRDGKHHYLVDVLPPSYTRADYNAADRAALRLLDAGRISVWRYMCGAVDPLGLVERHGGDCRGSFRRYVAIGPPGAPEPDRKTLNRDTLNVGRVPAWNSTNTYRTKGAGP